MPPEANIGSIFVTSDLPFQRGASQMIESERLPTYVDRDSGWVKIEGLVTPTSATTVLRGVIVEIGADGRFGALWLRPETG